MSKRGRAKGASSHVFTQEDVVEGIWCLVDMPPQLKPEQPWVLAVSGINGSGVRFSASCGWCSLKGRLRRLICLPVTFLKFDFLTK
jgi:hypothetical protein